MNIDRERLLRELKKHIWGPTGSILLHALIILALLKLTFGSATVPQRETQVMMMEPDAQKLDEINKEIAKLEDVPEVVDAVDVPENVAVAAEAAPDVGAAGPGAGADAGATVDFAALDMRNDVQGPLVMRGLYAGRSSGGRKEGLGKYAGRWGGATENAVLKALKWLKEHQLKDGSWGPGHPIAMTGLALLTFLAHGETTQSEQYGETVEKAIKYLVGKQNDKGFFTVNEYEHGIATYAISEAYGLTRIPKLKAAMDKAAQMIVEGQEVNGAWAPYTYNLTEGRDTSVSGWQLQALKAAFIAGADVPGLHESMERGVRDLKDAQDPATGTFPYRAPKSRGPLGMTGVGVLCLQLLGHAMDKETRAGLMALKDLKLAWDPTALRAVGSFQLYGLYYITQAKFHQGGATWSAWNADFARIYTTAQNDDGSWSSPAKEEHTYGPVYATTLSALALQVYYRNLPTYKPIEVKAPTAETGNASDVNVQISL